MRIKINVWVRTAARWARNAPSWMMTCMALVSLVLQTWAIFFFVVHPQIMSRNQRIRASADASEDSSREGALSLKLSTMRQDVRQREAELRLDARISPNQVEVMVRSFVVESLQKKGGRLVVFERRTEPRLSAKTGLFFRGEGDYAAIHQLLSDLSASALPLSLHQVVVSSDVSSGRTLSFSIFASLVVGSKAIEKCS